MFDFNFNSRRGIIVESRLGIATRLLSSLLPSFMNHYLAGFTWTFHFQILYLDLQTTSKKLKSSCRIIWVCEPFQIVNGLTFLPAWVLFNHSGYLHHSNKDSDWLILACFMGVWNMLSTLLFASKIKICLKYFCCMKIYEFEIKYW